MNNMEYIRNLMVIHRDLAHHITDSTKVKFDETISAAILALSRCEELTEKEVKENEMP